MSSSRCRSEANQSNTRWIRPPARWSSTGSCTRPCAIRETTALCPHILSDDGDPIDVLIANTRPIISGAVINVRPIGVLKMEDESGSDEKIIAVPMPRLTKRYAGIMNYTDLPEITLQQIGHFFGHYKDLEPRKWVKLIAWRDADEARRLIGEAIERSRRSGQS